MKLEDITLEEIRRRIGKKDDWENSSEYKGLDMGATHDNPQEAVRVDNYCFLLEFFPELLQNNNSGTPNFCLDNFNLWCWKGSIWWGDKHQEKTFTEWDFSGECTENIIYNIIKGIDLKNSKLPFKVHLWWLNYDYVIKSEKEYAYEERRQSELWNDILENESYSTLPTHQFSGNNKINIKNKISRTIPRDKRYKVIKRQGWKCNFCQETLKFNKNSNWEGKVAHIDHIHPFSKRDSYINGEQNINEPSNLQALCPSCNMSKSKKEIN